MVFCYFLLSLTALLFCERLEAVTATDTLGRAIGIGIGSRSLVVGDVLDITLSLSVSVSDCTASVSVVAVVGAGASSDCTASVVVVSVSVVLGGTGSGVCALGRFLIL